MSCPGGEGFRIRGRFRGYPIDASFGCEWVPGQGDGLVEWAHLMRDARGGTVVAHPFATRRLSPAERARRRVRLLRVLRLYHDEQRLIRQRRLVLAAANGHRLLPWQKPDPLALRLLHDSADSAGLAEGLYLARARIYSTTLFGSETLSGARDMTRSPRLPVYVLELRFAYRDYAGRWHLAGDALYSTIDARDFSLIGDGGAKATSFAAIGPATPLPL